MIYISKPNIIRFLKCDSEEIGEQTISYLESLVNKDFLETDKQNTIKQYIRECFYSDGSKIIIINIAIYVLLRILQDQFATIALAMDRDIRSLLSIISNVSEQDQALINQNYEDFLTTLNNTIQPSKNYNDIIAMNKMQAIKYIEDNIKIHNQNIKQGCEQYIKINNFKNNMKNKYQNINIL